MLIVRISIRSSVLLVASCKSLLDRQVFHFLHRYSLTTLQIEGDGRIEHKVCK